VDFTTFGRLLGFGEKDRKADIIHNEGHMKGDRIVADYELQELADGTATGPKGGSDSTYLRKYATNLIFRG
jgi:hypothetical protein